MTREEIRQELLEEIKQDPCNTIVGIPMPIVIRMVNEYREAGLKLDATLLEQEKRNPFRNLKSE